MLCRHVFGKISSEFRGISRIYLKFAAPRPREISKALFYGEQKPSNEPLKMVQIHTNVSNFEAGSPNQYNSWCMTVFYSCHKTDTSFKSLYGFGGRCLEIREDCMDFEPYFKVHNLVSVHPKSIILSQMTNLNMIFHMVVPFYRLVKI